jgi:hypothetical protein
VLSAQYYIHDFGPVDYAVRRRPPYDGFAVGLGGYFGIKFPQNTPQAERYDFDWSFLVSQGSQMFEKFDYDQV